MSAKKVCAISAIVFLLGAFAVPASADSPAASGAAYGFPDLDVRTLTAKPAPAQLAAADRLAKVAPAGKPAAPSGLTLRWSGYGTPQLLRDNSGYLTGPSGKAAADIVRNYLEANADLFRLSPAVVSGLELISDYSTRHNGATHIGFQLTDAGLPVFRSIITATVDAKGRIVIIGGSYAPDAAAGNAILLDETAALGIALEAVGVKAPARLQLRPSAKGFTFENTVADLYKPAPLTAELVSFPMGGGKEARIAWRTVTAVDTTGTYETIVDAETGDILFRQNRVNADHGAEGNVYRVQNPTLGSQQITTFIGIDGSWVEDRTTDGNNAIAYHDLDDTNTVGYQPQTPDNTDPAYQHFNYTYTDAINTSGGTDVTTDRDAVITQAFYYVNMLHDYYYNLGFDEVSRNFQDDNFGRGGLENDRVLVEVDNGFNNGDCCNAFMDSNNDGTNGRLTLRVGLQPDNLDMHRAMNGDTVTHEFGHGVSNRLVGSGDLGSGVQTGALGEGWSDALATELWNDPVYGEYNNGNNATGIRGVAYDTSTMVYSDLCSWSGGCQVHNDGRIWATVMWQVRAALIDTYGQASGAATHIQLMIDGMKNTPTDPSYLDARDGYLAADVTNNASANQCLLWRVFAEREMGFSASSVGNSSSIIPDTDVPAECVPSADAGGPYVTPEGQPETVDGSSSAESSDPSGGSIVSYAWDLDNDGDYDDAFGVTASFDAVGQDGVYTIGLQVTNEAGITDTDSTTVTVTNVTPTVTISAAQVDEIDEYDVIQVTATFSDPGWLDTYTYEIDWGTPAGDTSAGNATVTTEGGPGPDLGSVTDSHQYGDNGAFTITVTVYDDDGSGSDQFVLTVNNLDPTAVIDLAGTIVINGIPAIVAHVGEDIPFSADSTDPGSDDLTLTWDWDDGAPAPDVSTLYLVNPPGADPLPSPSVDPRDLTDDQVHAFTEACLYEVVFASTDDDSGDADDSLVVIISGNVELTRSAGYWYQAYRDKKNGFFTEEELECFLDIVGFMSTVFHEETDVSTIAQAANLLKGGPKDPMATIFDRQLLAVWLNFANGALDLETLIDTDGDDVPDTSFADVISAAEAARLNPATTDEELEGYKDLLETMNENSL
jgi:Zn-dependent metalloprotease